MLIDFHAHLYVGARYGEGLAETAKNLGIDRLCIGGGAARYGLASNAEVRRLADAYPEIFVPFAHLSLGEDGPATVERLKRIGFRGLCVWTPPAPYDAESFFGVYGAAEALQMPILFHTCYMPSTPLDRAQRFRSEHARPVYLDTVARCFPELKIVGVGLGTPWCEEAIECIRRHANVFFDLSGGILQTRAADFFSGVFGQAPASLWDESVGGDLLGRIVFGSAVQQDEVATVERDYQRVLRSLGAGREVLDAVMGNTAARILNLPVAS